MEEGDGEMGRWGVMIFPKKLSEKALTKDNNEQRILLHTITAAGLPLSVIMK